MTRRRAFLAAGGAACVAASGYAWSERRGLRREDLDSSPPTSLPRNLASLLTYAALAPSGHNTQPWAVGLAGDGLRIGSDRARWLPQVDPQNRELALSIGAFLENLLAAAPGHSYQADFEVIGNTPRDEDLIQVRLAPAAETGRDHLERIRRRRTVRNGQLRRPLSNESVRELVRRAGAGEWAKAHVHFFPVESTQSRYLAGATIEANRVQARRDGAPAELADWIRFSNGEARARRDGLTQESMEISGVAGWYVRHFFDRADVLGQTFRDQGVDRVRQQVENCGGWLVVTSPDSSLPSLLETGRKMERMWLAARESEIAIHPMTQVLEEPPFPDQVGGELGLTDPVQFVLRVGLVKDYPEPVSLRRPVSEILRA